MNLQYLAVFTVIFCMMGLRAFQQKVAAKITLYWTRTGWRDE